MKRFLIVLAVLLISMFGCNLANAQHMKKGMNQFNAGLGVAPGVGVNASYDYGLVNDWGPGIFTIGGYVGFGTWGRTYRGLSHPANYRTTAFAFAPRATYRYAIDPLFEICGTAMLGAVVYSYSDYVHNETRPFFAITGGIRYLFSTNVSLFAEVGFNEISFLNVGLSFSF